MRPVIDRCHIWRVQECKFEGPAKGGLWRDWTKGSEKLASARPG